VSRHDMMHILCRGKGDNSVQTPEYPVLENAHTGSTRIHATDMRGPRGEWGSDSRS